MKLPFPKPCQECGTKGPLHHPSCRWHTDSWPLKEKGS